jgi:hypothetical protein
MTSKYPGLHRCQPWATSPLGRQLPLPDRAAPRRRQNSLKCGLYAIFCGCASGRFRPRSSPRRAERDSGSAACRKPRSRPAVLALIRRLPDRRGRRNGGSPCRASALRGLGDGGGDRARARAPLRSDTVRPGPAAPSAPIGGAHRPHLRLGDRGLGPGALESLGAPVLHTRRPPRARLSEGACVSGWMAAVGGSAQGNPCRFVGASA